MLAPLFCRNYSFTAARKLLKLYPDVLPAFGQRCRFCASDSGLRGRDKPVAGPAAPNKMQTTSGSPASYDLPKSVVTITCPNGSQVQLVADLGISVRPARWRETIGRVIRVMKPEHVVLHADPAILDMRSNDSRLGLGPTLAPAAEMAMEIGAKLYLVDRDEKVTNNRLYAFKCGRFRIPFLETDPVAATDTSMYKLRNLPKDMHWLYKCITLIGIVHDSYYSRTTRILYRERELVLAYELKRLTLQYPGCRIVAVMNMFLVPGIVLFWDVDHPKLTAQLNHDPFEKTKFDYKRVQRWEKAVVIIFYFVCFPLFGSYIIYQRDKTDEGKDEKQQGEKTAMLNFERFRAYARNALKRDEGNVAADR